jgi:hypothetical protein
MLHLADAHGVGVLLAERNMAPQSRCAQIRMIGGLLTLGHAELRTFDLRIFMHEPA